MSNKKATKRALLTSITALAMCVVMLVGTTFAWFTDTATANVNKIQAGKLDVDIVDASGNSLEGQTLYFRDKNNGTNILWEPGATFNLDTFKIVNKGNLAIKYEVKVTGIKGSAKLLEVIDFSVVEGTLNGDSVAIGTLNPKGQTGDTSDLITIQGKMKESANNDYQGLTLGGIAITVYATQATYEYDSNNNTYDDGAFDALKDLYPVSNSVAKPATGPAVINDADASGNAQTYQVTVPQDAMDDNVSNISVTIAKSASADAKFTVAAGSELKQFDVTVTGIKSDNTEDITVELFIGKGYTLTNPVTVQHLKSDGTTETLTGSYDSATGFVTFKTTSFSPFAVAVPEMTAVVGEGLSTCYYDTLAAAFDAAKDGDTVTLLKSTNGGGIVAAEGKFAAEGLTVDFNGHSYTVGGVLVGSSGTGTNASQLLRGNKITFKNGSFVGVTEGTKPAEDTPNWHGAPAMMIQNYCDLTLENMTVTGGDETVYTMSNNCGNVVINNTTINAGGAKGYGYGPYVFDVCRYSSYPSVNVTVTGNSVINGDVEISGTIGNGQSRQLTINSGKFYGKFKVTDEPANITINGGEFVDLANAVKYAADGATIKLAADAAGSGLASADGAKVRDNLTIDFAGHTYTMVNPAVGSKGTETQAMHWGTSLSNITMKNGTFKVADNATEVAMAMQNYINFTAEGMTFDFAGISVAHYAENEFTGKYEKYNGKECPMFNNNGGKVVLTKCVVTLPEASEFGSIISGTMELNDTAFNGYVGFNDIDGTVIVSGTSSIKGGEVKDYFGDLAIVNNNGTWTATKNG